MKYSDADSELPEEAGTMECVGMQRLFLPVVLEDGRSAPIFVRSPDNSVERGIPVFSTVERLIVGMVALGYKEDDYVIRQVLLDQLPGFTQYVITEMGCVLMLDITRQENGSYKFRKFSGFIDKNPKTEN